MKWYSFFAYWRLSYSSVPALYSISFKIANLNLWGIQDGELLYVMKRRKDQIGEKEFAALPPLHHNLGQ